MDGLLPVWKPTGITSYDVIRVFKKAQFTGSLPVKYKVGHAGTLDPFAEGVLILMLGKGTKRFDEIQKWKKTYRAVAQLGASSDTLDRTGVITSEVKSVQAPEMPEITEVMQNFTGEIDQVVPQYSAAKFRGKPMYKYARQGQLVPEKRKTVTVYSLSLERYHASKHGNTAELLITSSSGTYIRQLSYDIFKSLGVESYLEQLVREKIGEIGQDQCCAVNELSEGPNTWKHKLIQ